MTLPAWDNSAMDGYAVRGADIDAATREQPVRLRVLETVAAGRFATQPVGAGEAIRIMTGAPMPDGADTVVRVEDTDGGIDDGARARRARRAAQHPAARRGLSARATRCSTRARRSARRNSASSRPLGASTVDVHRRPRVAIIGSGDELVDLDRFHEVLAGRKIVSSNGYTLARARARRGRRAGEPRRRGGRSGVASRASAARRRVRPRAHVRRRVRRRVRLHARRRRGVRRRDEVLARADASGRAARLRAARVDAMDRPAGQSRVGDGHVRAVRAPGRSAGCSATRACSAGRCRWCSRSA